MQSLGPRISLPGPGGPGGTLYQAFDVQRALTSPGEEQWVWDRLDSSGRPIPGLDASGLPSRDLTTWVDKDTPPVVTYDATQAVKRSLSLRLRGDVLGGQTNPSFGLPLGNQVRGHYQILMPDGGWVDFVIGTFVVLPTGGEIWQPRTWHDLQGTDYGQLLLNTTFTSSLSVPAGTNAVGAVAALAQAPGLATTIITRIPDLGRVLVMPITWTVADSRLKAINDVLAAVGYFPAWFDELGILRSSPLPDWNTLSPSLVFDGTQTGSILREPIRQSIDWSAAGNSQTVYVEDPRRGFFSATYVNINPDSPVSVPNLGYVKSLPPIRDSNIPDPQTAYLIAKHYCQAAGRIYASFSAPTGAWPLGQDYDVYQATFVESDEGPLRLNFVETGWSMQCQSGAATNHAWTQLVPA